MTDIPAAFWQGVDQFNQHEFYACHDTLEAVWVEADSDEKNFYQGILQIAVALYHLSNHNWRGTVILMGEGLSRLSRYTPTHAEIDVDLLLTETSRLLVYLQESGPEAAGAIAQQLNLSTDPQLQPSPALPTTVYLPAIHRLS
jgi:uncharacterized protein